MLAITKSCLERKTAGRLPRRWLIKAGKPVAVYKHLDIFLLKKPSNLNIIEL